MLKLKTVFYGLAFFWGDFFMKEDSSPMIFFFPSHTPKVLI